MQKQMMSRRGFFMGSAAIAAAGGLSLAGCAQQDRPTNDDEGTVAAAEPQAPAQGLPEQWDRETDVVVVGTGTILPAALRAADNGLEVLVLEKHPTHFGGTTSWFGGGCSCPNSKQQLEAGKPEVPRDLLKQYMLETADGMGSEEVIDALLDNYVPAIDYLADECDVPIMYPALGDTPGFALYTSCSCLEEEYANLNYHITVKPTEDGKMMGRAWIQYFRDALDERGIETLMGTPATSLIYKGDPLLGDGEVVGVWADSPEGPIAIKARYAVILGTGGFDFNEEMVKGYLRGPVYSTFAIETNTGDGHAMAANVGAAMGNMSECFRMAFVKVGDEVEYQNSHVEDDDLKTHMSQCSKSSMQAINQLGRASSIVVNKHGQRFGNESCSYDDWGRNCEQYDTGWHEWRNVPAYLIADSNYTGSLGSAVPQKMTSEGAEVPSYVKRFDTLEELADGMGINKENLLSTVERFNGFAAEGVDPDYNRGANSWDRYTGADMERFKNGEIANPCLAPVENGPFYVVEVYPGMMQTKGGIVINGNAQAVNTRGEAIPRLYAGSNCIANPLGRGYGWGGATAANGFVVGYIAANHIADSLKPWEEQSA